jgi:3-phosphoshikimate 1-carboxyvinyltransferase
MRQRPIQHLVQALRDLGADVSAPTGCPPVTIGHHSILGGRVNIPGNVSSQFISAILLAAPLASRSVRLCVTEDVVSRPYLDLTIEGMKAFGANVRVSHQGYNAQPVFEVIAGSGYRGREEYFVEGDASAASYFYGAAAVSGSSIRVEGVGKESSQGDARCADALAAMGCRVKKERDAITVAGPRPPQGILKGVDYDCNEIPDVVPTLAVVALFAHGRTRLRGVGHLRHKESDRIASVASEIRKLGGTVKELPDGLEIEGTLGPQPSPLHGARIETWDDHRIAMAFSLAGLEVEGVVLEKPQVVSKSFPGYFEVLRSLGVAVTFE